jgi:hypothetical protein
VNDITIDLDQADAEILDLFTEVSDKAMETAASTSAGAWAGASLWSSFVPAGCTCVTD